MRRKIGGAAGLLLAALALLRPAEARAAEGVTLAREWRFTLDRADAGVRERWFGRELAERIQLPGVLQSQGYGNEISTATTDIDEGTGTRPTPTPRRVRPRD